MPIHRFLILLLLWNASLRAQQYVVSTVAGGAPPSTPIAGFNKLLGGRGLATDANGNLYFSANGCIFRLDPTGVVTRMAGTSIDGYSGDGGLATGAKLSTPLGLAVDGAGSLFIADYANYRIRRVTSDGIITSVAGSGVGSGGLAGTPIGDGGPATVARLSPSTIAVDSAGNLFIGDVARVRKVSPNGIITTIAGNGLPGFSGDGGVATSARLGGSVGIATDNFGNLFIADTGNGRIREISSAGIISTVAGGGTQGDGAAATSALLRSPSAVAMDATGNLFVADFFDNRIRKISPDGTISTVAGTGDQGYSGDGGPATNAQLYWPADVAVDSAGNVFILDSESFRIRKVAPDGAISTAVAINPSAPAGDGGPATSAYVASPNGVAVDGLGNLFLSDSGISRIRKVSSNGVITTIAGTGQAGFSGDGGAATSASLNNPQGIALDSAGNLYIADTGNNRIRKVSAGGIISTVAGNGTSGFSGDGGSATAAALGAPKGVAVDSSGNVFIADSINNRVREVSPAGTITTVAGSNGGGWSGDGGPATAAFLAQVSGVAVDTAGNLYIAAGPIRKISPAGVISTPGSNGSTNINNVTSGYGIAVDTAGILFVTVSNSVRKVSPGGVLTTVATFPAYGGSGTAAPPSPAGVTVDNAGHIYVADTTNSLIRVLTPTNTPQPAVSIGAVVDAASQRADPVTPGKIVVIYGTGLGPSQLVQNQTSNGRFGTQSSGTSVSIGGIAAPLLYTSATQVAAIAPYLITGANAQVIVNYQGQASPPFPVTLAASAPSLFTANQTGAGQAAVLNADYSVNTAANPVPVGGYISLYATGEGLTSPAGQDGMLAGLPLAHPMLPVTVLIGGIPATVQYDGGAPGLVEGLMQVNVQIPNGVQPGGYVPVILKVGDSASGPGVWIAVSAN